MFKIISLILAFLALQFITAGNARANNYYVSTTGSNSGNGSLASPWATIKYALGQVSGGDTIIVRDGTYNAGTYTTAAFNGWVTLKAENPYRAKLTNLAAGQAGTILFIATPGSAKIIVEGFHFSNVDPGYTCTTRHSYYLLHIQDAQDIVLRNNIFAGNSAAGGCNELLKVNRGSDSSYPKGIMITENLFYDPANANGADLIDSVRPGELDIVGNIFFSRNSPNSQSFITLKTEVLAAGLGIVPRSPRYKIQSNVFLNWSGKTDQAFVQLGEDTNAQPMITDALIENNLMIGNSSRQMAAPFQFKGARNITVRANTIVGDFSGNSTFGFRIGTEGDNHQVRNIFIYNNIWADPSGTMGQRFINSYGDVDASSIQLDNNLFWNNGNSLPAIEDPAPSSDVHLINADPLLQDDHSTIVLPVFYTQTFKFLSGSTTIRQEFERLVNYYGYIPTTSAARDSAASNNMPTVDILGNVRDNSPDVGAFEYGSSPQQPGPDDTEAPQISIVKPAKKKRIGRRLRLRGTASDNVAVAQVQYQYRYKTMSEWLRASGTDQWSAKIKLPRRGRQRLRVWVRAIDTSGIESVISRRTFKRRNISS